MTFIGAIFTPFYITYIQSLNGSFIFAGSSLALFSISTGVLIYFLGKSESHYTNKRNLIAIGYAIRGSAFILIGISSSHTELIIVLVLLSIGSAMSLPAFDALYTRHLNTPDSSIQWADLQAVAYIVTGIAAFVGALLIQYFGFREIFISLGILAICVSVSVYYFKDLD